MSNKTQEVKKLLGNRIFISLLMMVVVIVTVYAITNRPADTVVTQAVPKKEEVQVLAPVKEKVTKTEEVSPVKEPGPTEEKQPLAYKLPLQGELQKGFSADELVWDETMEDWRTHKGVDIASEAGDEVDTAAPGTVTSAKLDGMQGYVVEVDHGDGVVTVYKNLAKTVVAEGDTLDEGQMIGTVGDTAPFEMAQKAHLHFEVINEGEYVNPLEFIK